jgi:hypothetical protein
MNIQDLENKYKELGAEIERLKQQPEGVWEPKRGDFFFMVDFVGDIRSINPNHTEATKHNNVYKTRQLAEKASVLQRTSNLVIQACLNFDPDFVPDWKDLVQQKYGFSQAAGRFNWRASSTIINNNSAAYVSTAVKAVKVVDYLNSQESN